MTFVDEVHAAADALHEVMPSSPLQRAPDMSAKYGAEIWLKREDLNVVRSYKLRGAYTFFRKALAAENPAELFVCASAGNHAQGFAWCCSRLGVEGVIFMPTTTPGQKVSKTRKFGGASVRVELEGDTFDECLAAALAYAEEQKAAFVPPFDAPEIITGQATVTAEVVQELGRAPDVMVLPVGGGGLSAGATSYLKALGAATEIICVEPREAASLKTALEAGGPVALNEISTFVDGAAVARIGAYTFDCLKSLSPESVQLVPENRLCGTILHLLNEDGLVLEPAGALAIDVLPDIADKIRGKTVVCVASGGNFDFERLPEVKERALRFQGLKKYYVIRMPQRPGALKDFLFMLGPNDDIFRFEYLKKSARNFGSVLIGIDSPTPESFAELQTKMEQGGIGWRDITDSEDLADLLV